MPQPDSNLSLPPQVERHLAQGPDTAATEAALARLARRLDSALPPMVYYASLPDTLIGEVWVAATSAGLYRVDFDITEGQLVGDLAGRGAFRPRHAPEKITPYLQAVDEYLRGDRTLLDLPVDLRAITPFQRSVLLAARGVPRGQVATYAEIARRIGKPRAFRAVGQALRHNPIPIVLPCHRVISSDGTLGGYGGALGSARKIELLKLEGVILG